MKSVALICLLFVAIRAAPIAEGDNEDRDNDDCGKSKVAGMRIVGGSTAQKGQYPWIASLRYRRTTSSSSSHTCGCSIIDDQWMLVAAHCFINSDNPSNYIVRIGTYNQTAGSNEPEAKEYTVAKIVKHAQFSMTVKIQNDIALLKLTEKIDFNSQYVAKVCLPTGNYPTDNEVVTVTGWGDTVNGNGKAIPDLLKHTDLTAQTDKSCKSSWGTFMWSDGQMVCAVADNTSPCVGDSGGPLMHLSSNGRYTQVGVVSFGESSCAGPRPPVFTRVSYFLDWIKTQKAANP